MFTPIVTSNSAKIIFNTECMSLLSAGDQEREVPSYLSIIGLALPRTRPSRVKFFSFASGLANVTAPKAANPSWSPMSVSCESPVEVRLHFEYPNLMD